MLVGPVGLEPTTYGLRTRAWCPAVAGNWDTTYCRQGSRATSSRFSRCSFAVMLVVFAQRGDNAKAMRVVASVIIALAVLGVATTGRADEVGTWLASLVMG